MSTNAFHVPVSGATGSGSRWPVAPVAVEALPPVAPEATLASVPGVVDLFCLFYESVAPELLTSWETLLQPDERTRQRRFHFDRDRRLFLATRALVRTVLSSYVPAVSPSDWRFAVGPHGKPTLSAPKTEPPLHFNLAHTPGLVVCAVSGAHESLGVDVEWLGRSLEPEGVAERFFSAIEVEALRALPAAAQRQRFLFYWTLKESYIKARGLGLSLPLDRFWFQLDEGPAIDISFAPELVDRPARWRFALLRASQDHLAAVGVDSGGATLSLRASSYVPLQGIVSWNRRAT